MAGMYSNQSSSSTTVIVVVVAIAATLLLANSMLDHPILPLLPPGIGTVTTTPTTTIRPPPENLTAHEPIVIIGNEDFQHQADNNNWSGDGSASNPYIIEGYVIESSEICINIMYTTLYFEIRYCSFSCPEPEPFGGMGVNIWEADNGLVDSCTFREMEWGVNLFITDNCDVRRCDIEAGWIGVNVSYSSVTFVADNTIQGGDYAVFVDQSTTFAVLENNLCLTNCGLAVWGSTGGVLRHNNVSYNDAGIEVLGSSEEIAFETNWVIHNSGIGIDLGVGTSSCLLFDNQIGWNGGGNALDNGLENYWDNGEIGNAWSDYEGSGVYVIPGSGESVDNFPSLIV
ncbi:MAG: nitrous oxide reductase family maturation protein NosD [Promethearchaeota archaeon]